MIKLKYQIELKLQKGEINMRITASELNDKFSSKYNLSSEQAETLIKDIECAFIETSNEMLSKMKEKQLIEILLAIKRFN